MSSTIGWLLLLLVGGGATVYLLAPKSSNGPGCPTAGDKTFAATIADIRSGKTDAATATAIFTSYQGLGCKEAAAAVHAAMVAAGATPPQVYKAGPTGGKLGDLGFAAPPLSKGGLGGGLGDTSIAWPGLHTLPMADRARALALVAPLDYAAIATGIGAPCGRSSHLDVDLARMTKLSGYGRPNYSNGLPYSDDDYIAWLLSLSSSITGKPFFPDGPIMKSVPGGDCPTATAVDAFRTDLAARGTLTPAAAIEFNQAVDALATRSL